jgi:hypothetical protein
MKKLYNRMAAMGQVGEMTGRLDRVREIAAKMEESRRLYISLWGLEKLKEQVAAYRPLLEAVCSKQGCSVLQALIMILKDEAIIREQAMVITAVVAEILEPTPMPERAGV